MESLIVETVLRHYPKVQGIYLFGSYGAGNAWPDSDVDIALLLPHAQAKAEPSLAVSDCRFVLSEALKKEVDLINLREVSTVFQKEIIFGKLIYCDDRYAVDEFEMLTLSYYQKLNEERREIVEAFYEASRARNE